MQTTPDNVNYKKFHGKNIKFHQKPFGRRIVDFFSLTIELNVACLC